MALYFFFILTCLILLSGLLAFRKGRGERNFSITLVQTLLVLPLLACEYLYLSYHWEPPVVQLVLFSELVFVLIWFSLARRLSQAINAVVGGFRRNFLMEVLFGAALLAMTAYLLADQSKIELSDTSLIFSMYGPVYFLSILALLVVLFVTWRLEEFWRPLTGAGRWEYKFLVVGCLLVCGTLAWSSSYRLTYLTILPKHLQLLAVLLLSAWAMISYAVFHNRLLNRKIFVSRKVVYAFVVPSLLAAYLLGFGVVSLLMRTFDLEMSFVLKWVLLTFGLVAGGLFALSGKIRRRAHFYISTHFYINKYEYRDQWLALSLQLQGASSETEIIEALREVLAKSLYTTEIFIWLAKSDSSQGYKLVSSPEKTGNGNHETDIGSNDPLVGYLHSHSYFSVYEKGSDQAWQEIRKNENSLLSLLNLTLVTPITIGNQLTGLIGLGPEFTGGQYGYDDFDLLIALGSQTASALLAVRIAEELAHTREQQAWHRLSSFVLHDIKNAATMLSMLQENAPEHIHEPEFQQDMLELVDDALRRMGKVEQRLGALKDELAPELQDIELCSFLQDFALKVKKKLPLMEITIEGSNEIQVRSDPELLESVVENLLLNAYEARGEGAVVRIKIRKDDVNTALVEIIDNGPGIAAELLPEVLFEPFKTSKDGGSGIGLWQVKRLVTKLGGAIAADNHPDGGAQFVIRLP